MSEAKTNGPAAAALIAAGVGCAAIGIATILATASPGIADALNWKSSVGTLSGKTGVGIIVWVVSWAILHAILRKREPKLSVAIGIAAVLIAVGFIALFPPVYDFFAPR